MKKLKHPFPFSKNDIVFGAYLGKDLSDFKYKDKALRPKSCSYYFDNSVNGRWHSLDDLVENLKHRPSIVKRLVSAQEGTAIKLGSHSLGQDYFLRRLRHEEIVQLINYWTIHEELGKKENEILLATRELQQQKRLIQSSLRNEQKKIGHLV